MSGAGVEKLQTILMAQVSLTHLYDFHLRPDVGRNIQISCMQAQRSES